MAKVKKRPTWTQKQNAKAVKRGQRNAMVAKVVDARLAKYEAKQATKQMRKSEYYKTKRTTARSTAIAGAITASEESRQKTARLEAQQRTQLASMTMDQYSRLINGEQGSENVVNPDDNSGNPSGSWVPNDVL